uniref:RNA1 polyprotein n=1 Tax=Raspberry ringspot virus TaxID=12809 RepID=A0A8K1IN67_9SECO|nr:polyprotein [Raspberry ringspot virus]
MGWTCPIQGCVYARSTWSNRGLKEDGLSSSMRCPGAMCGALLVRSEPVQVPKVSVAPQAPTPTALPKRPVKAAAPLRRQDCAVVVEVGSPALLSFVYPALAGRTRHAGEFDSALLARRPSNGGTSRVPTGWLKPRAVRTQPTRKAIPPWLSEARRLIKGALKGSNAFGPRYCRDNFPRARLVWVLGMLSKSSPPSPAIGRQLKKSFLALQARIASALAKKQSARTARRQEACRKIRLASQQARGVAALARQQARQLSGAGLYSVRLCTKRALSPTVKVPKRHKNKVVSPPSPVSVQEFPEGLVGPSFWETSGLLNCVASPQRREDLVIPIYGIDSCRTDPENFVVGPKSPSQAMGDAKPRLPTCPLEALNLLWASNLFEDWELDIIGQMVSDGLLTSQAFLDGCTLVSYYGQEQMVDSFHCLLQDPVPTEVAEALAVDVQALDFDAVFGCGISDFLRGTRDAIRGWIMDPVIAKSTTWCNTIIDKVRALFDKYFAPFHKIIDGMSYVNSLWAKCKEWAQSVLKNGSQLFSVMWETHCVSFVIIITCACTLLVENVLKELRLISRVGTLTGCVISGALGILGCGMILTKCEDLAVVSASIRAFLGVLLCPPTMEAVDLNQSLVPEEIQATSWTGVDRVLGALNAVGSGLTGFNTDTIIYWGRFAQSFDGMRRGKDAVCALAAYLFEKLGTVYNRVTGKEAAFFHELSSLVSIDVQGWLNSSRKVMAESIAFAKSDAVAFATVERLINDGETIQLTAASAPKSHSMQFGQILAERLRELRTLRNDMAHAGSFEGRRCVPFWLYIYGPPGVGKTTTMHEFSQALLTAFEFPSDSLTSKSATDKYWSLYRRQALVQIDDLGAISESGMEQEMMNIVSSATYNPTMAVANEKTTLFDSKFIVSTSNGYSAGTDAKIHDRQAFNRRRRVVIKTRGKAGVAFNPHDSTAAAEFCVVERDDRAETPIWVQSGEAPEDKEQYWMDFRTTVAYVIEQARVHHNAEDIEQAQYSMKHSRTRQLYQVCENYIGEVKMSIANFVPGDMLGAWNLEPKGRFFYSCVDGRVYSYDPEQKAHDEGPVDKTLDFEQICLEKLSYTLQADIQGGPKSATAGIFLRSMVSGECAVESVDKLNKGASREHLIFFKNLSLADRVYLRLVQKRILQLAMVGDPLGVRSYTVMMEGFQNSYNYVKENGGRLLLILCSCMLLGIACYTFFNALAVLIGGTSVAAGAAAMVDIGACGSTSTYASEYGAKMGRRNMPHRSREIPAVWSEETGHDEKWQLCGLLETCRSDMPAVHVNLVPGNKFAITKHQAQAIPDGSSVGLSVAGRSFRTFQWRASALTEYAESEICTYFDSRIPSLGKQAMKMYSDSDLDALNVKYFSTRTLHFRLVDDQVEKRHWDADACVISTPKTIVSTINGVIYRQEIPTAITYRRESVKHDCGALVFTEVRGKPKAVGMLVGTLGGTTYVCKFPHIEVDAFACVPDIRGFNLEAGVSTLGYSKLGWLDRRHQPHNSEKTEFVPIPEKYHMDGVPCKIPAILSASDPRLASVPQSKGYDPYKNGMEKFAHPMQEIDEQLLATVCDEIAQEFHDVGVRGRMVSMDEAINGHHKYEIPSFYVEGASTRELNELRTSCSTEVWHCDPGSDCEFEYPRVIPGPVESKWKCESTCCGSTFKSGGTDAITSFVKARSSCCEEIFFDGLDLTTSEGYPLFLDRPAGAKGKERFFEGSDNQKFLIPGCPLDVQLQKGIEETHLGTPQLIIKESAKDELLREGKVLPSEGMPGTRLFSICPAWYNIAVRQHFVYIAESVRKRRRTLSSQVGIVVGSREWDDLAARLRSKKNDKMYCCDYSKFDGLMTPQIIHAITNIYERMFSGKDGMSQFRQNLLMGICNRISICGSQVYRVEAGMPSGFALTVDFNSIFNEILVRCAYRSLVPEIERPFFSNNVVLIVYGDDNVLGIHPNVESAFNGNTIKAYMKEELGIKITDGADKLSPVIDARPLEQCEFLKRTWRKDRQYGLYRAPLVETSIYSCLRYVRLQNYDWQAPLLQNVQGSLYEASLHGPEMHARIYTHFAVHFPKWVEEHELYTYEQCRTRFIAAKNGDFNFHPASAQMGHVFSQQTEIQELSQPQNPKRCYQLHEKIHICGPGHNENDCFYVDVRVKGKITKGKGFHHAPVFSAGSGQLGTVKWASSFRSSSACPMRDAAVDAFKRGECIYFRDNGELINAWLAAINFGMSINADGLDGLLQVYRNCGPTHLDDLSFYFEGGVVGVPAPAHLMVYGTDTSILNRLCPKTVLESAPPPGRSSNVSERCQVQTFLHMSPKPCFITLKGSSKVCHGLRCSDSCRGHISCTDVVRNSVANQRAAMLDVLRRGCYNIQ